MVNRNPAGMNGHCTSRILFTQDLCSGVPYLFFKNVGKEFDSDCITKAFVSV